ncbi:MAG: prepilin-type N-terminal cleavage/methylation domain-containing protein [Alteromonas naphthalenivorans]|jgi:prepilin-type N-terminal cleavage/methylation domain-containing protein
MKLNRGFALIEVLFSLTIGSILALLLFQSIGSMSKTYQKIFSVSSVQRRFTLVQQQFARDFSGIVAPKISLDDERGSDEKKGFDFDQKKDDKKKAEVKTDKDKKQNKSKTYRIPHVFFSKNDSKGNCSQLTCLTTNPVSVYGQSTQRLVRVVYSLEPDPEHEGLFLLARQQSDILDFKEFSKQGVKAIRKFTISDSIEKLKISFLVPKKSDKESKPLTEDDKKLSEKEKKKKFKVERHLQALNDWPYFEDEKEEKKKKRPSVPTFIKVEATFVDEQKRPSDFLLWYAPLYDAQSVVVEDAATLPSMSEMYHRQFMEHRQKDMQSMRYGMREQHG